MPQAAAGISSRLAAEKHPTRCQLQHMYTFYLLAKLTQRVFVHASYDTRNATTTFK